VAPKLALQLGNARSAAGLAPVARRVARNPGAGHRLRNLYSGIGVTITFSSP
jgi:hypothetical protein